MDPAARLLRRPDHPVHRLRRRAGPCPARQRAALRKAEAADGRRGRRAGHPERRLTMTEMVGIPTLLLVFLIFILAGGVWIAIALLATGYVGMQFIGGGIPSGPVLATTIWGNSNSWT